MESGQKKHIAIVGSRDYPERQHIVDYVNSLPEIAVIVSGGARGVDTWAEQSARKRGLSTRIFPVDTRGLPPYGTPENRREYGRRAFTRNTLIIEAADTVIAFWCKKARTGQFSSGTRDSIDKALRLGKQVEIVVPDVMGLPQRYHQYLVKKEATDSSVLPANFFDPANKKWREQLDRYRP